MPPWSAKLHLGLTIQRPREGSRVGRGSGAVGGSQCRPEPRVPVTEGAAAWLHESTSHAFVGCYRRSGNQPGPGLPTDSCTAANSRHYSTTSSAAACNGNGTVRPSALAILRLITSSNFVGCVTGSRPAWHP